MEQKFTYKQKCIRCKKYFEPKHNLSSYCPGCKGRSSSSASRKDEHDIMNEIRRDVYGEIEITRDETIEEAYM